MNEQGSLFADEPDPRHFARRDGPPNSFIAAYRAAPSFNTRKGQVLRRLLNAAGEWVPGHELQTPACGGSEGLRRVRELREVHGYAIEERPARVGTTWEYRLRIGER
jgi:hypothetical protein